MCSTSSFSSGCNSFCPWIRNINNSEQRQLLLDSSHASLLIIITQRLSHDWRDSRPRLCNEEEPTQLFEQPKPRSYMEEAKGGRCYSVCRLMNTKSCLPYMIQMFEPSKREGSHAGEWGHRPFYQTPPFCRQGCCGELLHCATSIILSLSLSIADFRLLIMFLLYYTPCQFL